MKEKKLYNKSIVQLNKFSVAEYSFTTFQRDIITFIQASIDKNSKAVQKTFTISLDDFSEFKGTIKRGVKIYHNNEEIKFDKKLADNIINMPIGINLNEKHYIVFNLWEKVEAIEDKLLSITINETALQLFYPFVKKNLEENPHKNFTKLITSNLVDIKSATSVKLLEILSSHYMGGSKEKPVYYSIGELRLILGFSVAHRKEVSDGLFTFEIDEIEDIKFVEPKNFKLQLERCIKIINELKECNIKNLSFSTVLRGRKTIGFNFIFFNTNGIKDEKLEGLMKYGLTKNQAIKLYSIFQENYQKEINKRLALKLYAKGDKWFFKSNGEPVKNKTAYLVSIFPELEDENSLF